MDLQNVELFKALAGLLAAFAALLGGMYAVITRPLVTRMDDHSKRFDEIIRRLERIELKLETHTERITRLEERASPFRTLSDK